MLAAALGRPCGAHGQLPVCTHRRELREPLRVRSRG
jgi:hypothetical protein